MGSICRGVKRGAFLALVVGLIAVTGTAVQAEEEYARYDKEGKLLLPEGYRSWVYVGGSVTPNEMNEGRAPFPEFHNVYIDPAGYRGFRKTGRFPDGTVLIKETVGVGGKSAESGKGYFMGEFIGLFAGVKDAARFAGEPQGWAFFTFRDAAGEPTKASAAPHRTAACSSCHQAGASERVFTQYYPVLR